jgi:hypothetical protein
MGCAFFGRAPPLGRGGGQLSGLLQWYTPSWGFLLERSKDRRLLTVPVIVISASLGIENSAKTAGAHSVMRKPLEPNHLLSVIEPILKAQ